MSDSSAPRAVPATQPDPPTQPDPLELGELASAEPALDVDVVIVGAGISGIGAAIELLRRGRRSFVLLESEGKLGGTWRDNTYPGVACDIPSISYCYSFETDYPWSRAFAPGHEIQAYVEHCARKYAVEPHIRYHRRVRRCVFEHDTHRWRVELNDGTRLRARFVFSGTGTLSQPKHPNIDGLDRFAGKLMHTARWDHAHSLSGQRVGIIGTGASAVQVVPSIVDEVAQLSVFQRTPIWVSLRPDHTLRHGPLSPRRFAPLRALMRFGSELALEVMTFAIVNYRRLPFLVGLAQHYLRGVLRQQVRDATLRRKLTPAYGLGCKRPATSNRYLPSFGRDHVALVTERIERVCPEGVVTSDGALHPLDTLILATGFLTTERGNTPSFEVVGEGGVELGQLWEEQRMQAYSGVSVPGFPNFFLSAGPYAGGFNWFTMLETHLRHIMQCIEEASRRRATRVEVDPEAHARYMDYMWKRADGAIFKDAACLSANSYYLDRHGDAALPFPQTPWWRALRLRFKGVSDYRFE